VASNAKWKTDGKVTKSGFSNRVSILTQGFLNDTGALAVNNMRGITSKHDASGELTDSIMWATGTNKTNMGSRAKDSKAVDQPADPYTMRAGSAAEHAIYRETTSGIHETADGKELFLARMKVWCEEKLGINPDGPPEDQAAYWRVVNFVRTHITDGVPFVAPTKEMIDSTLSERYAKIILRALRAKKE
jgi:hypothetical protein